MSSSTSSVLARGVRQCQGRLARLGARRQAHAQAAARQTSSSSSSAAASRPWKDVSLVYVENDSDHAAEQQDQATTTSSTFGCDLQANLFHVNAGKAITTLRDELPQVLERELSYDIYTEDVAFVDDLSPSFGRNSKTTVGKDNYKRATFGIRFHTWLFFSRAKFEVARVWQPHEDVIAVRWTFRGLPRIIGSAFPGSTTYVDGISEFKLNRQGLIYQHKVDNLDKGTGLKELSQLLSMRGMVGAAEGTWPGAASYLVPVPVPVEAEGSVYSSYSEDA